jgi:hypothetical protein
MPSYFKPDGTKFVLAHHTPEEWADALLERLRAIGCSEMFARRLTRAYRQATASPEKEPE